MNKLTVADNQLSAVPPEIGKLYSLDRLNLEGNQIETLPAEMANLKMLRDINLKDNRLRQMPKILSQLPKLRFDDDEERKRFFILPNPFEDWQEGLYKSDYSVWRWLNKNDQNET